LASSILVAVISAHLAVKLALKRFYSEKWWERRAQAYALIIESIHHIREHASTNLVFSQHGKELPPDGDKDLTTKLQQAIAELRKQRDIGSFVISEEAVSLLNDLFTALDASTQTTIWHEHLEMKISAIDDLLPLFRQAAASHLKVGNAA